MLTPTPQSTSSTAPDYGYVSEFERFMGDYLEQHPQVQRSQRLGWRQYWDRSVDFKELKIEEEDNVPFHGYDYF